MDLKKAVVWIRTAQEYNNGSSDFISYFESLEQLLEEGSASCSRLLVQNNFADYEDKGEDNERLETRLQWLRRFRMPVQSPVAFWIWKGMGSTAVLIARNADCPFAIGM